MAIRRIAGAVGLPFLGFSLLFAQNGGGQTQSKPPVKRVRTDLSGFDLDPRKSEGTQVGGASRGGQASSIILDAPRKGLVYSLHPWFQWQDPETPRDFVFRIFDSNGDEVFETNLDGSSLQYPADAPELKPGAVYSWTVQHSGQSSLEPPLPAQLSILSESERKQLTALLGANQGEDLQSVRNRAEAFVAKRLWYDSIEAYSKLIAEHPQSAELYRRRGEIYSQLAATTNLAKQDFERAEKLK